MTIDEAIERKDNLFKSPIRPITKEQYEYALGVLPPKNWKSIDGGEYFQMMEHISGSITSYYVSHNGLFYSFADTAWMSPVRVEAILKDYLFSEKPIEDL